MVVVAVASRSYQRNMELVEGLEQQAAHIPAPSGGVTVDNEARAAIDQIRQLLIDLALMAEQ